jgi:ABC-type lipoprotein export system ATPase subunit
MLNVKNLTYAYESAPVLKNISFSIQEHEIVGILGLSGSGKTTLLKILSGLAAPDEGNYTLEGIEAYQKGKRSSALATELGVVFQQFNLFMHLSVVDNLALPLRLRTKPAARLQRTCLTAWVSKTRSTSFPTNVQAVNNSASPSRVP